jgi:hypothetical protein
LAQKKNKCNDFGASASDAAYELDEEAELESGAAAAQDDGVGVPSADQFGPGFFAGSDQFVAEEIEVYSMQEIESLRLSAAKFAASLMEEAAASAASSAAAAPAGGSAASASGNGFGNGPHLPQQPPSSQQQPQHHDDQPLWSAEDEEEVKASVYDFEQRPAAAAATEAESATAALSSSSVARMLDSYAENGDREDHPGCSVQ